MRVFILNKIFIAWLLSHLFINPSSAQVQAQNKTNQSRMNSSFYKNQSIIYKIIQPDNSGYGYDIFINNTLFIHQPVIPCFSGNKRFKSKTDAKKVAVLVIEKIRKGIIPPSVTLSELQKIAID